ncbi:MAG: hypothetical protein IJ655_05255 [Lachnospiraceae bacterium]|nr:hypothetical protein [Lachnospiraceae bacterium]
MEKILEGIKRKLPFWVLLLFEIVALFLKSYEGIVNEINTTMLAFSYRYGFISRGFVGTLYDLLEKITPFDMFNRWGVVRFTQLSWAVYLLVLLMFFAVIIRHAPQGSDNHVKVIIFFYTIFAIPFFLSNFNFGRSDMWMLMMSLMAICCLVSKKFEFLAVPLCGIGVMVHQGYVFMFVNIVLVFLLYRALEQKNIFKNKYMYMFIITFLEVSALFLYFEKFSHGNGPAIVDNVVSMANSIIEPGKEIHQDVIDKEILGISLADREAQWRRMNHVHAPIFIVCMLPYVIIFIKFFKNILQGASDYRKKAQYGLFLLGAGTMVPELILKCDYGRWTFAIISYYIVVVLALIAENDKGVVESVAQIMSKVKAMGVIGMLILVYPVMFQPLGDVAICGFVASIAEQVKVFVGANWW